MVVEALMNLLRAFCRVVLGIVFILSGLLKVIDPIGGSLKIKEYLTAFHLGFLDFVSLPVAVLFASAEFVLGVAVLKGLRMKLACRVALYFMAFFTVLTLYSAIFSPVEDCGCFGEAIHLTNWQTFFKNVVLILCATFIFFQRDKFKEISTPRNEWYYVGGYSLLVSGISLYSLLFLPQVDFGAFKAGTDLVEYQQGVEKEYNTILIYSKDGKKQEFTLENLPDSTWSFVDSKTTLIDKSVRSSGEDFSLKDIYGEYVGSEVFPKNRPTFILSFYNIPKLNENRVFRAKRLCDSLSARGVNVIIISGGYVPESEKAFSTLANVPLYFADYKTLLTLNRSNGGLTYTYGGYIVNKWSKFNYPANKLDGILENDPEIVMTKEVIKEQLFIQILFAFIFIAILVIRYNLRNLKRRVYVLTSKESSSESKDSSKE